MNAPIADVAFRICHSDRADNERLQAAANARFLLRLARNARFDGLPKSDLRASNARAAARKIVEHAKRSTQLYFLNATDMPPAAGISGVASPECALVP